MRSACAVIRRHGLEALHRAVNVPSSTVASENGFSVCRAGLALILAEGFLIPSQRLVPIIGAPDSTLLLRGSAPEGSAPVRLERPTISEPVRHDRPRCATRLVACVAGHTMHPDHVARNASWRTLSAIAFRSASAYLRARTPPSCSRPPSEQGNVPVDTHLPRQDGSAASPGSPKYLGPYFSLLGTAATQTFLHGVFKEARPRGNHPKTVLHAPLRQRLRIRHLSDACRACVWRE